MKTVLRYDYIITEHAKLTVMIKLLAQIHVRHLPAADLLVR